jgi:hypothetical protein
VRKSSRADAFRGNCFLAVLLFAGLFSNSVRAEEPLPSTAPAAVRVAKGEVWRSAERMARSHPGAIALRGEGASMLPVYPAGTAVVVTPVRYGQLQRGMAVVYLNARGIYVAHRLISKQARGWRVAGLNNAEADAELVTADNLVGVITSAFTAVD